MLNPQQLADRIDAIIARSRVHAATLDCSRVATDILSSLPPDDRRGIDPSLLELIVAARGKRTGSAGAPAQARLRDYPIEDRQAS